MLWYPIGPDFVFRPHSNILKRLSRRNESCQQGMVKAIAIHPVNPDIIYTVERPGDVDSNIYGENPQTDGTAFGSAAFKTINGGKSWVAISDEIQILHPDFDPRTIILDPVHPEIVYLGSFNGYSVARSLNSGLPGSWTVFETGFPYVIRELIIDPRTAGNPANTVVYAVTDQHIFYSLNGCETWNTISILDGNTASILLLPYHDGSIGFLIAIRKTGIFYYHSTDPRVIPATITINLNNGADSMLPLHTMGLGEGRDGNFDYIHLGKCNNGRVYALFIARQADPVRESISMIYTSISPETHWDQIAIASDSSMLPDFSQALYCNVFAVAPNSPGDGVNDILMIGTNDFYRSINSGRTWQTTSRNNGLIGHSDLHAFAFAPGIIANIPFTYIGCDGGLARHYRHADPTLNLQDPITDFSDAEIIAENGGPAIENLNHGKQSSAVMSYSGVPGVPAINYIGCQDTGLNGSSDFSQSWRCIDIGDVSNQVAARGHDAVNIWLLTPNLDFKLYKDRGSINTISDADEILITSPFGGVDIYGVSKLYTDFDHNCICMACFEVTIPLTAPVHQGHASIFLSIPNMVFNGDVVTIQGGGLTQSLRVMSADSNILTADFPADFDTNAQIHFYCFRVVKVDGNGFLSIKSKNLKTVRYTDDPGVFANGFAAGMAINHGSGGQMATTIDTRVWTINNISTANEISIWEEATIDIPNIFQVGNNVTIVYDTANTLYVLSPRSIEVAGLSHTPLFRIEAGRWIPELCDISLPPLSVHIASNFYNLMADPVRPGVLYCCYTSIMYRITKQASGTWSWENISEGLPRVPGRDQLINAAIYNFGTTDNPNIILRAGVTARGVWELDLSRADSTLDHQIYMRDNRLDHPSLPTSPDNAEDPFNPAEHVYHWQSADIKVDAIQTAAGGANFFQNEPENPITHDNPLPHAIFNIMADNSQTMSSGIEVNVHVQVHNRGRQTANNVKAWAIWCDASTILPSLNLIYPGGDMTMPVLDNTFNFWSNFSVSGGVANINPVLPPESAWNPVVDSISGHTVLSLSNINAYDPQVASWRWTAPTVTEAEAAMGKGHYCIVVFIHSAENAISESSRNIDVMVPRNKQIAQKNLHIMPAITTTGSSSEPLTYSPDSKTSKGVIVLNNPDAKLIQTDLVFDLKQLPEHISLQVSLPLPNTTKQSPKQTTKPNFISRLIQLIVAFIARMIGASTKKPISKTIMLKGSSLGTIHNIEMSPLGRIVCKMEFSNHGKLEPGEQYRFDVLQKIEGTIRGGSSYILPVAGQKKQLPLDPVFYDRDMNKANKGKNGQESD